MFEEFFGIYLLFIDTQVPTIGIIASGGGFRAMTAFGGAMKALSDTKILDCVTYLAGLSGSSW